MCEVILVATTVVRTRFSVQPSRPKSAAEWVAVYDRVTRCQLTAEAATPDDNASRSPFASRQEPFAWQTRRSSAAPHLWSLFGVGIRIQGPQSDLQCGALISDASSAIPPVSP